MNEVDQSQKLESFTIDGEMFYKTLPVKKHSLKKKYQPRNFKEINALIPGTIQEIHVKEGQKVSKGDRLLALDAMKMINQILSPMNGVIKKIHVQSGAVVIKNQLLVELK
jgi:biotin carboxyl carrier protein